MTARQLDELVQAAFDGSLDEARGEQLRRALRESPAALDVYCRHAVLDSALRSHATGAVKLPGAVHASARLALGLRARRRVVVSLATAAVLLLCTGIVLSMIWISQAPTAGAAFALTPGSVLIDAEGSAAHDSRLPTGKRFTLTQGVLEIEFGSGTRTIIEGPAEFQIGGRNSLDLTGGQAWFHAPPQAAGFQVNCPRFRVTDLGTEFGIDQREGWPASVHLITGSVEIQALGGKRAARKLRAEQAAVLTPAGDWQPGRTDRARFRTSLPVELPRLELALGEFDGHSIPLRGTILGLASASAVVHNPQRATVVPGIGGSALELDGAHIETDWPGISGTAPRSFACWLRLAEAPAQTGATAPPLAWWGDPTGHWNRKFKVAVVGRGDRDGAVLRVSFGGTFLDGATPLPRGEWRHIAVVYAGNDPNGRPDLRAFIDGQPEPLAFAQDTGDSIATATAGSTSSNLALGRYELPADSRDPFLRAALCRYQILAGALNDERIRELAAEK